jgi:hypothetical protein
MWFSNWRTEDGVISSSSKQREDLSHAYLEMDHHRFPADCAERNGAADDDASFVIAGVGPAGSAVVSPGGLASRRALEFSAAGSRYRRTRTD